MWIFPLTSDCETHEFFGVNFQQPSAWDDRASSHTGLSTPERNVWEENCRCFHAAYEWRIKQQNEIFLSSSKPFLFTSDGKVQMRDGMLLYGHYFLWYVFRKVELV